MNRKERRDRQRGKGGDVSDDEIMGPTGLTEDMANELKRYLRKRGCPHARFILCTPRGVAGNGDVLVVGPALLRGIAAMIETGQHEAPVPLEADPEAN